LEADGDTKIYSA